MVDQPEVHGVINPMVDQTWPTATRAVGLYDESIL